MWFEFKGFPSYGWIKEQHLLAKSNTLEHFIVLNIVEFKSKADYEAFRK
jgi:hypothetical protein